MLHGRRGECARIEDLIASARAGDSASLVLRGEAGIGKSALLAHAADLATGMRVLRGTGVETESELPFAGLHRLLLPVRHLVDLLPEAQCSAVKSAFGLGPVAGTDRWLLSLAVLNLLAEAAVDAPVLCIDRRRPMAGPRQHRRADLRRASHPGRGRRPALRRPRRPAAAVRRTRPTRACGWRASTRPPPTRCSPNGRTCRSPQASATGCCRDTLGNPLALAELAESLTAEQLGGSAPLPERLPVGPEVEHLFGDRVRRQPADTQTLLLVAAANHSDDLDLVVRAARSLGVDAGALDSAEAAGLVTVSAGTLTFRHPLVRSAIYRGATSRARRAAEQALADALDAEKDGDRRAWHRANAATGPDETIATELARVGERAGDRGGHVAATAAYERAAELTTDDDARAVRLADAAEAAWLAGEPDRARDLLDRAAPARSDALLRGRIAHLRGSIEAACGAPVAAYATLLAGAELVAGVDPEHAGRMLSEAGQIAWGTGDLPRIMEAGRLLAALPTTSNPGARAIVGLANFMAGDGAGAARELAAAADLAETSDQPQMVMLAAAGAMFLGDDVRAIDLFTRAIARVRAAGAAATLPVLLAPLSTIEMFTGRYGAATTNATEGLRLATETGQDNPAAHARSVLAWLAAVRGRSDDCVALANEALAHAIGQRLGPHAAIATWALAHDELASGRSEQAFDRLQALAAAAPGEGNQMVSLFATADLRGRRHPHRPAGRGAARARPTPGLGRQHLRTVHAGPWWRAARACWCRTGTGTGTSSRHSSCTPAAGGRSTPPARH